MPDLRLPMSARAYAKRVGVSHTAVYRALKSGRLRESVRDGKIIDPELADKEWVENTDYTDAPHLENKFRGGELTRDVNSQGSSRGELTQRVNSKTGLTQTVNSPRHGLTQQINQPRHAENGLTQRVNSTDDDKSEAEEFDNSVAGAAAREKHWRAKLSELKFKEAAKELISAADVKREWTDILSRVRTKFLGVPTRIKQAIPALTLDEMSLIEGLLRETLEDLSNDAEGAPHE